MYYQSIHLFLNCSHSLTHNSKLDCLLTLFEWFILLPSNTNLIPWKKVLQIMKNWLLHCLSLKADAYLYLQKEPQLPRQTQENFPYSLLSGDTFCPHWSPGGGVSPRASALFTLSTNWGDGSTWLLDLRKTVTGLLSLVPPTFFLLGASNYRQQALTAPPDAPSCRTGNPPWPSVLWSNGWVCLLPLAKQPNATSSNFYQ